MIYNIIKHSHSGLRWALLLVLAISVLTALYKIIVKSDYNRFDRIVSIVGLSLIHSQFVIGLALYFTSPKVIFSAESMSNPLLRFFLVEHSILMLLSVILFTWGYLFIKKTTGSYKKHLYTFLFYSATLLIIVFSIPWPWKALGGTWI